jgi:hypothetical protein
LPVVHTELQTVEELVVLRLLKNIRVNQAAVSRMQQAISQIQPVEEFVPQRITLVQVELVLKVRTVNLLL